MAIARPKRCEKLMVLEYVPNSARSSRPRDSNSSPKKSVTDCLAELVVANSSQKPDLSPGGFFQVAPNRLMHETI